MEKDGEKESDISSRLIERVDPVGSEKLAPLAKAYFVGDEGAVLSNALTEQAQLSSVFKDAGALPPVYDPNILALIYENSSTLRPNVDAYVTNIDSYGNRFEPVINLDSEDAKEKVRDALRLERKRDRETGKAAKSDAALTESDEPSDSEVADRMKQLRIELRSERASLENFFANCTSEMPFSGPEGLRGLTRQDIEVLGSGYWEVLRNGTGAISQFNWIPARTMRLLPMDPEAVLVKVQRRISLLSSEDKEVRKRFRRFVQVSEDGQRAVFFKELGDPRAVDAATGRAFASEAEAKAAMEKDNKSFRPATEVLWFKINSTRSVYGVPRWIGAFLAVMGTRQAEEVNFLYFENRSVPPLALLVSGGRLNENTVSRLEDYIQNQIRGKRNFHKIMILEAEPAGGPGDANTGRMKIELRPLTDAQQKDALFQGYDERNADKVGQMFRLPRLLRGDVRDFNRSTAEASVDFAEIQVFGPIRQQFDWTMDTRVLTEIGVRYHTFRSNAPTVRDPEGLSTMIKDLVTANVLTPGEGRELAEGVFNRDFEKIRALWTSQAIGLTLAGRGMEDDLNTPSDEADEFGSAPAAAGAATQTPGAAGAAQAATGVPQNKAALRKQVSILARINRKLIEAERETFKEMQVEHVTVPRDLFLSCFTPDSK